MDQSTASRWLKSARLAVYEETKRRLKERLRLSSHEFESLLSDINSRLDLSFSQILKEEEEEKLRQAVREAVTTLSSEQRHLLRLHFVARRSPDELSRLSDVDSSTVSHRLASARQAVHEETKRRFLERLGSAPPEVNNLLGDINIQIDLLLCQILKEGKGEA